MSAKIMMPAAMLAAALCLGGRSQDTTAESELVTAIKATAEKGFTYTIRPAARMPSMPKDRVDLAGVPVTGAYVGGVTHAKDGAYEIYRKGDAVAANTGDGWLPLDKFTSPLRLAVRQAFDPDDRRRWARGNVTEARKALRELFRISHLVRRSNLERLTNIGRAFSGLNRIGKRKVGGEEMLLFEGDLTDLYAFELLQGPYDELVQRGTLAFQNVSGVGRVYLKDGFVRRVHIKAGGKFQYFNDEDNVRRKGMCALEVLGDLTAIGETGIDVPKEAAAILDGGGN